jgi:hypothetical protein
LLDDLKGAADRGAVAIAREVLSRDLQARRPALEAALSFCLIFLPCRVVDRRCSHRHDRSKSFGRGDTCYWVRLSDNRLLPDSDKRGAEM